MVDILISCCLSFSISMLIDMFHALKMRMFYSLKHYLVWKLLFDISYIFVICVKLSVCLPSRCCPPIFQRSQVFRRYCGGPARWVKLEEGLRMELPRDTVLLAENVTELRGEVTYCQVIFIYWTLTFVGRTIYKFNVTIKYLFTSVILNIIWNPRIQVSINMSIIINPRNFAPTKLNDFTVNTFLRKMYCTIMYDWMVFNLCMLQGQGQKKVNTIHALDALFLFGKDLRSLHFNER